MSEHESTKHRIWPRAAGLGAFALFCSAFLLAVGLVELVLLAAAVAVSGALVFAVGWLLVRERETIAGAAVTGHRLLSPVASRSARVAWVLLLRSLAVSARAARAAFAAANRGLRTIAREAGPAAAQVRAWVLVAGARTGERTRASFDSAAPVVRRAQREAIEQLRAVGSVGGRQASRAAAVVASDLAAHRRRARAQPRKGRELPPPSASVGWAAPRSADVPTLPDPADRVSATPRAGTAERGRVGLSASERTEHVLPAVTRRSRSRRSDPGSVRKGRS